MKRYVKAEKLFELPPQFKNGYGIDIKDFAKKFNEEYDFLYDVHDRVSGYYETVDEFDELLESSEKFKNFVREFSNYRMDIVSSDREAAAFIFAMKSLGLLN